MLLHVRQHGRALGRRHVGHHPAGHHHHFVRRDRGHQRIVHARQFGIGVALPQHAVVGCLLFVHVLEVVRHKQCQLPVQGQGGRRTCGLGAGHQVVHPVGQGRDGLFVLQMFARNVLAGAGLARLHGGVHKLVLVVQVRAAQVQQLHHAVAGLGKLQVVVHIHAPQAQQRVGHEGAQRLVDAGVHVHAGGGGLGLGQCGNFAGINLHHVLSWPRWALSAPFLGRRAGCTMHPLPCQEV